MDNLQWMVHVLYAVHMVHVQHMHVTRACIYKKNSLRMPSAKNYFVSTYSYTSHSTKVGWLLLVKQSIGVLIFEFARLHFLYLQLRKEPLDGGSYVQ